MPLPKFETMPLSLGTVTKIPQGVTMSVIETVTQKSIASCVKFTLDEYKEISEEARTAGKSIPVLLKIAYFKRARTVVLMKPEDEARWFRELRYWGKNMNQIAKRMNCGMLNGWHEEIQLVQTSLKRIEHKILGIYGHG